MNRNSGTSIVFKSRKIKKFSNGKPHTQPQTVENSFDLSVDVYVNVKLYVTISIGLTNILLMRDSAPCDFNPVSVTAFARLI